MGAGSIVYFAVGGAFSAIYSNALRRLPYFSNPGTVMACSAVGATLGFAYSNYESKRKAETQAAVQLLNGKAFTEL
eukprot:m.34523 g.34523  ORF g.34523 m.34523 type:complete len:76 (+) comp9773_c0_seq1:254-481(+)